jgi:hypothetical protein
MNAIAVIDVPHVERDLPIGLRRAMLLGIERGRLAPDHHAHQGLCTQLRPHERAYHRAVPQHADAVRQVVDLAHPVADVDDRDTLGLQRADDGEELLRFARREAGRRLIHDQDMRVASKRARDLDQLALGDGERYDAGGRAEGCGQTIEIGLCRGVHRRAVDHAVFSFLFAEKHVLGDGEVGCEGKFLIDHRNAAAPASLRAADLQWLAVDADLSTGVGVVGAGENFHQRRFAGAVLPHQGVDLTRIGGQRNIGQRLHRAEGLADAAHLQRGRFPGTAQVHRAIGEAGHKCVATGHSLTFWAIACP